MSSRKIGVCYANRPKFVIDVPIVTNLSKGGNHYAIYESMTSIIARLCWKYRIRPIQFISTYLEYKKYPNSYLKADVATALNSFTDRASENNKRFYKLTGINCEVNAYIWLQGVFSRNALGVMSKKRKWCPECYKDRILSRNGVYDDLYWVLELTHHCVIHECKLAATCSSCGFMQPYISNTMEPGFCNHCGYFLGKAFTSTVSESEFAESAPLLTSFTDGIHFRTAGDNFKNNLKLLTHELNMNNRGLSRFCGFDAQVLNQWVMGKSLPTMESLFVLQSALGLKTMSMLWWSRDRFKEQLEGNLQGQLALRARGEYKSGLLEIKAAFNEIFFGLRKPVSKKVLADELGVSVGMLDNAFRDETKKLSCMLEESKALDKKSRENDLTYLMERAVSRCYTKGRPLGWSYIVHYFPDEQLKIFSLKQLDDARELAIKNRLQKSSL